MSKKSSLGQEAREEVRRLLRDSLRRLRDAATRVRKEIAQLRHDVYDNLWKARCALYVWYWEKREPLIHGLVRVSEFALLLAAGLFALDMILVLFGHELAALSWTTKIALLLAGLLVLTHRFWEVMGEREQLYFITGVRVLVEACVGLTFVKGDVGNQSKLEDFIGKALLVFHKTFEPKGAVNTNIMLMNQEGYLKVAYVYPPTALYDPAFQLLPGQGGAGVAFQEGVVVYIPATTYMHGITVDFTPVEQWPPTSQKPEYQWRRYLFIQVDPEYQETFESIVSVPVLSSQGVHAILNFDSHVRDGFNRIDFQIARVWGQLLGIAFQRFEQAQ